VYPEKLTALNNTSDTCVLALMTSKVIANYIVNCKEIERYDKK